ncbi:uncharacterized protein LOC100740593 [Bombus impatiens]|uniref:Uncharacterized protein LOC100740593 n=1 Tax=Bombus impatiens TaxID=132113 RepID=A0A6P3UYD2_BOMIM|nr:uncharacterized protein LOC100740593 [Bombus impatiens]
MQPISIVVLAVVCCYIVPCIIAKEDALPSTESRSSILDRSVGQLENEEYSGATLNRQKRTLLLKKKLIGAGLLGFGLGAVKGYKLGYKTAPEVHHVYVSSPPASVKYVEYVDKPVFVERIIERPTPVFKPVHVEYRESSPYGPW